MEQAMQYQEFLRMAGATEQEVTLLSYRTIERQYMERDDLFPTKDEVVAHYHRFGWWGFSDRFIERLDALRSAVMCAKIFCGYMDRFDGMLNIALTSPGRG